MGGIGGLGPVHWDNRAVVAIAAAVALVGPASQEAALVRLRPTGWVAGAAAAGLVWTLLAIGGRLQHDFIYFQF